MCPIIIRYSMALVMASSVSPTSSFCSSTTVFPSWWEHSQTRRSTSIWIKLRPDPLEALAAATPARALANRCLPMATPIRLYSSIIWALTTSRVCVCSSFLSSRIRMLRIPSSLVPSDDWMMPSTLAYSPTGSGIIHFLTVESRAAWSPWLSQLCHWFCKWGMAKLSCPPWSSPR